MTLKIKRAAVLGAGVMGSQIAALLASAGVRTHLLDLKTPNLDVLKTLKPSPLFSAEHLHLIIPGNFDDDFSVLSQCDWVIEVVAEKLEIKRSIFKKVFEFAPPHIPITSNTSGISLEEIAKDFSEFEVKRFFGTHFFNPPRYMKLLEIIPHSHTDKDLLSQMANWLEFTFGKGIVFAKDTVNFIGNRIGVFNMQRTFELMDEYKLNFETVDALTGKLVGRPSSATFRTCDVVGLDVLAHVAQNTYDKDPKDPFRSSFKITPWFQKLIDQKFLGQKSGSGFYKKSTGATKTILVYRPETNSYDEQKLAAIDWLPAAMQLKTVAERLNFAFAQKDPYGQFLWALMRDTFIYSAHLVKEIADDSPQSIDHAIEWGFNWEQGPFKLWQELGIKDIITKMGKTNIPWLNSFGDKKFYPSVGKETQPNSGKEITFAIKAWDFALPKKQEESKRTILANSQASLVDIGDGVACFVMHSKMNALDQSIMDLLQKSVQKVEKDFGGMVISNEGEHFSAGANLKQILSLIAQKKWSEIEIFIREFQGSLQALKFASFPSVSCPHGLTLGGGCEVALHATKIYAAGETYAGLVEIGVGLLPAGGGTKELALRAYDYASQGEKVDAFGFLQRAFLLIGMAKTSTSGFEAVEMGLLPRSTQISIGKDQQTLKAKNEVLQMLRQGYVPQIPKVAVKVLGDPGVQTFKMMLYNMKEQKQVSEHDAWIGEKIATILCGGNVDGGTSVSENYLLELERKLFVELCQSQKTAERIEFMLKNGKPLRN